MSRNITIETCSTIHLHEDIKEDALDTVLGLLVQNKIITTEEAQQIESGEEEYPEFDCTIQGSAIPYDSGSYYEPPEGGYCEDFVVFLETECELKIARSKRYKEVSKKISKVASNREESKEKREKARRLAKRFELRSQYILEVDLTEYLTTSCEENLNEKAYEDAIAEYCRQWEDANEGY